MSQTKEIDIVYKGNPEKVTIRKMGWVEKNEFMDTFVKTTIVGSAPRIDIKAFRMRVDAFKKCTVKAPFKLDDNSLAEVDHSLLDNIYKEIEEFNELTPDQKKNLDSPSETEQTVLNSKKS